MRRALVRLVAPVVALLGLVVGMAAPAGAAAAPAASGWLETGFNGARSNLNAAETTVTPANVGRLHLTQTLVSPGKSGYDCPGMLETPLFGHGRVYVLLDHRLQARSLATGATLWRTQTDPSMESYVTDAAVVRGDVVLATNQCNTSDSQGSVSVYDAATGKHVRDLAVPFNGEVDGLAVSGRYVTATFTCQECSGISGVAVWDLATGRIVWGTPQARFNTNVFIGAATIVGQQVFEGRPQPDGTVTLRAYGLRTGKIDWSVPDIAAVLGGDSPSASARSLVVEDSAGTVDVLDPTDGALRFTLAGARPYTVLAVGTRRIFASCSLDNTSVCAYSAANGSLLWQANESLASGSGLVAGNLLYLVTGVVLNVNTGATVTTLDGRPDLVGDGYVGLHEKRRTLEILTP